MILLPLRGYIAPAVRGRPKPSLPGVVVLPSKYRRLCEVSSLSLNAIWLLTGNGRRELLDALT
jgi:hypothetical protein